MGSIGKNAKTDACQDIVIVLSDISEIHLKRGQNVKFLWLPVSQLQEKTD